MTYAMNFTASRIRSIHVEAPFDTVPERYYLEAVLAADVAESLAARLPGADEDLDGAARVNITGWVDHGLGGLNITVVLIDPVVSKGLVNA